jgi:lipoprotein-anchoring transpeptidase ErfK/SrfK
MDAAVVRKLALYLSLPAASALLGSCVTAPPLAATRNQIIISVRDQRLTVVKEDHTRETFPISTSKFGLGDRRGTYETPTGRLAVAEKIGGGSAPGTVFHGRVRTGEIVKVDAPGRDAIVTRILALRGLEPNNSQAFSRGIYIHGTPEERNIGKPASFGCVRMRSADIVALYDEVGTGARVTIADQPLAAAAASALAPGSSVPPVRAVAANNR